MQNSKFEISLLITVLFIFTLALSPALVTAAVNVTIEEVSGDVVATASGTLDTSGATNIQPGNVCQSGPTIPAFLEYTAADNQYYAIGPTINTPVNICLGFTLSTAQGLFSGVASANPDSGSGGFGVEIRPGNIFNLYVPDGYVSGTPLSSTSTFSGTTLAGIGLTPGSFLFDFGDDTITFTVVAPSASPSQAKSVPLLPLPTLVFLVLALAIIGLRKLRLG